MGITHLDKLYLDVEMLVNGKHGAEVESSQTSDLHQFVNFFGFEVAS